ncbi:hypothetical protein Patl1_31554 [Pistacia atlantica]|uniref:Uncharacterized protein n=1 Tax=Pistacia atlantica TaxID=434234 RepID=A0ACC1AMY7_9ROSI|nr:hypothetical protein Patl1_31554 [Pistacia atlantica]
MSVSVELLSIKNPNPRISFSDGIVKRALCTVTVSAKASEIEIEKESEDLKASVEESNEAWKQTLESFKEQALKMQSISQEAYEIYSKKALIILQETSEQLKIQAEKGKQDLTVVAKELSEEGKEYLTTAAENSPEVKEIVETFTSSTDDLTDVSKIRDFHVGIPYGLLLSLGGFLSFMVTGSLSAIRFGVILGGTLLALSISSLRAQNRGETSPLALKGQAAIATIILLRELRLLSQRFTFPTSVTTLISAAVVAFYVYKITGYGQWRKGSGSESGAEN